MNQLINNKIYKEVWEVLNTKKDIKGKIPEKVLHHIKQSASKSSYQIVNNENMDILKLISTDAFCLYLSLYLQYVAEDKEKETIKKILIENEIEYKSANSI